MQAISGKKEACYTLLLRHIAGDLLRELLHRQDYTWHSHGKPVGCSGGAIHNMLIEFHLSATNGHAGLEPGRPGGLSTSNIQQLLGPV